MADRQGVAVQYHQAPSRSIHYGLRESGDLRRTGWIGVAPGEPNDMLARILVSLEPGADPDLVDRGAYLVAMQEQYAELNAVRAGLRPGGAAPPAPVTIDRLDTRLESVALMFRVEAGPRAERAAHSRRLGPDDPPLPLGTR